MTSQTRENHWIAARLAGGDLTLWNMQSSEIGARHTTVAPPDLQSEHLAKIISDLGWKPAPIFGCGFATAASDTVPAPLLDRSTDFQKASLDPTHLVPSIHQKSAPTRLSHQIPALSGFLSLNPNWDGVICIADTHSSAWVHVSANEVISFETSLSPRLARDLGFADWDDVDLLKHALEDSLSRPAALALHLSAAVQANQSGALTPAQVGSRGWGHLLGAELAATRPYWLGQNLALLAVPETTSAYETAFKSQFLPVTLADFDRMTLIGLGLARKRQGAADTSSS